VKLTIPEKIQLLRKRMGMNQGQFGAKAFNTSEDAGRTKIKNIELGKQKPTPDDLIQISSVLNVPASIFDQASGESTVLQKTVGQGIAVDEAVLDRFQQLGPYLEMLNRAVTIEDEELIEHIAGKLSDVFAVRAQPLKAINN
jgi:transcriptional regulator with XRE-family HTH domain